MPDSTRRKPLSEKNVNDPPSRPHVHDKNRSSSLPAAQPKGRADSPPDRGRDTVQNQDARKHHIQPRLKTSLLKAEPVLNGNPEMVCFTRGHRTNRVDLTREEHCSLRVSELLAKLHL